MRFPCALGVWREITGPDAEIAQRVPAYAPTGPPLERSQGYCETRNHMETMLLMQSYVLLGCVCVFGCDRSELYNSELWSIIEILEQKSG